MTTERYDATKHAVYNATEQRIERVCAHCAPAAGVAHEVIFKQSELIGAYQTLTARHSKALKKAAELLREHYCVREHAPCQACEIIERYGR